MVRSNNVGYDRHITIFSPDGKLYQLEYALRAVKCSNLTGLAVKDDNAIAVVSQKKLSAQQGNQDVLLDQSSVTHLYHITDEVMALLIGFPGDCMSILYKSREIALEYQYKSTPSTHTCACSVGAKDQEGENALERILKQRETVTLKEKVKSDLEVDTEAHHLTGGAETRVTVEAIKAMIAIDAYDQLNGAKSIEVAICTRDNPVFRQLSEQEIETYLTHIAESD
ncbi:proteasome subunit alpha type 6 [Babesia ovata]|uniref:Proteasome subunit alpha type n=1 Tax=Babesia ovata TaxID=189622 RepID=A0A2H6KFF1_9APIC|nr:proteasome subunit alpha type 6 [Babesia ovata]GBE61716.1 proteasome subunit alpha type 6 [Babesia ovata]